VFVDSCRLKKMMRGTIKTIGTLGRLARRDWMYSFSFFTP
jgi:hypothetical protein